MIDLALIPPGTYNAEVIAIAQSDPDERVTIDMFNDVTYGSVSLEQLADEELDDTLIEDVVAHGGFADRSTPVDTLMAAPCGLGLEVADNMEQYS